MVCLEKLIENNILFVDSSDMNQIVTDVINDCRDHIHFTRKLFQDYWSLFDSDVRDMMNTLSDHIFRQFVTSIGQISITSDIDLLVQLVNQTNQSNIEAIAQKIDKNLNTMNKLFANISSSNSTLPQSLAQSTIDKVRLKAKY